MTFHRDGFTFHQVKRAGNVAIYQQTSDTDGQSWFEVVVIRERPARTGAVGDRVVTFPAGEQYPSVADWGKTGWTYTNQADALSRFNTLARSPQG
jgi:hypothetical protein